MKKQLIECLAMPKRRDIVFDTLTSGTASHYERWANEGDGKTSDDVKLLILGHFKKWKRAIAKRIVERHHLLDFS
jgi:hypothetical protein